MHIQHRFHYYEGVHTCIGPHFELNFFFDRISREWAKMSLNFSLGDLLSTGPWSTGLLVNQYLQIDCRFGTEPTGFQLCTLGRNFYTRVLTDIMSTGERSELLNGNLMSCDWNKRVCDEARTQSSLQQFYGKLLVQMRNPNCCILDDIVRRYMWRHVFVYCWTVLFGACDFLFRV